MNTKACLSDEELLAEHFAYEKELKQKRVRRRMNWKTVVAIAACLAVFACVILFPYENSKSEPVEKLPVSGEASESVMIYGGKISTESGVFSPLSSTEKIPDGWLNEISVYHEEDAVPESVTVEIQGKNYTYKYKESYGSNSGPTMHMCGKLRKGVDRKNNIKWV